jgi:gliding motility-associated lipoprotein GldH
MFFNKVFKLLLLFFLLCTINQCTNSNKVSLDLPKKRWYKTDEVSIKYNNLSVNNKRNVNFSVSYIYGIQFSEIPIEVHITSPLNKTEKISLNIKLFDNKQNDIGECLGDYCDFKSLIIKDYVFLEKGEYEIRIINTFDNKYLPNIISLTAELN